MSKKNDKNVIFRNISSADVPHEKFEIQLNGLSETEKLISKDSQRINDLFNKSYIKMDEKFIDYLEVFTDATRCGENAKLELKKAFFWMIMVIMFLLVASLCVVCILSVVFRSTDLKILAAVGSLFIESITAIIVLPKIIAEYLFNKEEEANRIEIIKAMQEYNDHKNGKKE